MHEYGLKRIPPSAKQWLKICRPRLMHLDVGVEKHQLRSKHPAIWKAIHDLRLSYFFRNSGNINVRLVRELYARWDPENEEQLVPIRGRLIDISDSVLCAHLGEPDVPHDLLGNFIN